MSTKTLDFNCIVAGMRKRVRIRPEAVTRCQIVKVFQTISHINVVPDIRMAVIVFIRMRVTLFRRIKANKCSHHRWPSIQVRTTRQSAYQFIWSIQSICKFDLHEPSNYLIFFNWKSALSRFNEMQETFVEVVW